MILVNVNEIHIDISLNIIFSRSHSLIGDKNKNLEQIFREKTANNKNF